MVAKTVTLHIDDRETTVPAGTMIVDAAMQVGIHIPVFCYHPKLQPVGMCRMCLVEIGRPVIDRATGQVVYEANGKAKIAFGPKLETACTTPASDGMVVVTTSQKVIDARRDVIEFLLTSHPLDCPVCDKGGECPLQNLTLAHGPGQSRFIFDEKLHLQKALPLGELIVLDRERCIQCGRCIRFQTEIVNEPVIAFYERGRSMEIITNSNPGFDSIFSGNTTDICPVGALTSTDFRFGARPWELKATASICNHCAVGCNMVYNVRRQARTGGKLAIKRVMPRQNEMVNELWMCDKGRFVYHYTESRSRLTQPMLRKQGGLVPVSWDEALETISKKLISSGNSLVSIAGGRLANEDLFTLYNLTRTQGGKPVLYTHMSGSELTAQTGFTQETHLGQLEKGDLVLVIACDLHEEAPIWWLRLKQAAERGTTVIVANPRPTAFDAYASRIIRYRYGEEAAVISAFLPEKPEHSALDQSALPAAFMEAAEDIKKAENVVIIYGSEGMGMTGSAKLADACARLLLAGKHAGKPKNGLLAAWPNGNLQGAWEIGFRPEMDLSEAVRGVDMVFIAGADPAGDDPRLAKAVQMAGFVVVQELFLTETARLADAVLPVQAYTEREGSYTSGERRVQRFYPAVPPLASTLPDFSISAQIAQRLGRNLEGRSAALVMDQIAAKNPAFLGIDYVNLAKTVAQVPIVGRDDLYYGGTIFDNHQGLGVQLASAEFNSEYIHHREHDETVFPDVPEGSLLVVPVTRLYDRGSLMRYSTLLEKRAVQPRLILHPETASMYHLIEERKYLMQWEGLNYPLAIRLDENVPQGVGLFPRSTGIPLWEPAAVRFEQVSEEKLESIL
jgi:NADH-quinone oxidoreductase subunit G